MKNREREIETLTAGDKRRKVLKKAAAGVLIALAVLTVLCGAALFGGWLWFRESVEKAEFDPALLPTATALPVVLDRHGNELAYAADNFIEPGSLPRRVTDAFVALEDKRFYSHKGYDPKGMLRAVIKNIGAGRTVEGASTITQQLVKNTHLSAERTLERKLKEIAIAAKIEQNYSKDEILSMYLSVIYFGSGAYGIKEASRVYFGCAPEELTVAQAATLAGILKNPAEYSPKNHPENAVARRDLVLDVMYRERNTNSATPVSPSSPLTTRPRSPRSSVRRKTPPFTPLPKWTERRCSSTMPRERSSPTTTPRATKCAVRRARR